MVRLTPTAIRPLPPAASPTSGSIPVRDPEAAGSYRVSRESSASSTRGSVSGARPTLARELRSRRRDTRSAEITMSRPAAIAGRLFDENGDPVEGVTLRAQQVRFVDGRRRLVDLSGAASRTDDQGRFRIFGLEAGEYFVSACQLVVDLRRRRHLPGTARPTSPGPRIRRSPAWCRAARRT